MGEVRKAFRALTHLSVHRDREQGERPGESGADFVSRGDKVELDEARAGRLLQLGAIEPWDKGKNDEPGQYPTARDMSGKSFPDAPKQAPAADPAAQPEAKPVQPDDEAGKPAKTTGTPDPYAKS